MAKGNCCSVLLTMEINDYLQGKLNATRSRREKSAGRVKRSGTGSAGRTAPASEAHEALQVSTTREHSQRQRLATGRFQPHWKEMSDGNNQEIPWGRVGAQVPNTR